MEDQVQGLQSKGIKAECLSSMQHARTRADVLDRFQRNPPDLSLLFVTPEALTTRE